MKKLLLSLSLVAGLMAGAIVCSAKGRLPQVPVTIKASQDVSINVPSQFKGYKAILILQNPQAEEVVRVYITEEQLQYELTGLEATALVEKYLK